jgi:hypothetical protein
MEEAWLALCINAEMGDSLQRSKDVGGTFIVTGRTGGELVAFTQLQSTFEG